MLESNVRDSLSLIHLRDVHSCTQEIWVKNTFASQVAMKKCGNTPFPPHYKLGRGGLRVFCVVRLQWRKKTSAFGIVVSVNARSL